VIQAEDIKIKKITDKLLNYEGQNPYINYLKKKVKKDNQQLTKSQIDYINKNHNKDIVEINNVISVTKFFGEELQKQYNLKKIPEKILIETLIGENDKSYHVLGKFYKNQEEVKLFWLPKTQLVDDLFSNYEDVSVDFEGYEKIDKLGRKYFDHQKKGVKFLLDKKKCILADDMGLGKTTQAILAALESGAKKILIVCPSSLKINWQREIENFESEDDISIIRSIGWDSKKFTIINYDILKNFHTILEKGKEYNPRKISREIVNEKFDVIILDESHYIKNSKSNRGKIIQQIIKESNPKYVWLLTGTPIANRPMDYFNLLSLIKAPVASDWMYYARRYCGGKQIKTKVNGKLRTIYLSDGASNLEELGERTKTTILRRKKNDVLDLPEKLIIPTYLELENREGYESVYDKYLEWRRSQGKGTNVVRHLVELILLRKFIALEKVKNSIELAESAIENGKKVLIFTNFTEELDKFKEHFGKVGVYLDGRTKEKERQNAVDKFQNDDKIKVFVGQIKAAGVGLTLTKAEIVIINSLDWVPGNLEQAEDRAYRIGQIKDVTIYYPLFDNTVDTLVWKVLQNKKSIINTIVGDIDDQNVLESIIEQL
jgi:SWI/SNF-related matrix-associated actin-dependent regulator 1 of chromatin subfamily A